MRSSRAASGARRLAPLVLMVVATACSGDDDATGTTAATASTGGASTATATSASGGSATTAPPSTTGSVPGSPVSVLPDTLEVGGTSLSTVDLATGAATRHGSIGDQLGVLGLAVAADGTGLYGVTDIPSLLQLAPDDPGAFALDVPVDAGGDTLLALASRRSDGALFAVGSTGTVYEVEPSGATSPVAEYALPDPGVGIDVGDDGRIELAFATGERVSVDPQSGSVDDLPSFDYSEQDVGAAAAPHVVAIAHDGRGRFGIDAAADVLVAIADDGTLTTIGPLGIDVSDGASLDIAADGTAYLASPG